MLSIRNKNMDKDIQLDILKNNYDLVLICKEINIADYQGSHIESYKENYKKYDKEVDKRQQIDCRFFFLRWLLEKELSKYNDKKELYEHNAYRICDSNYKKIKRLKNDIQSMIDTKRGYFVTMKFNNEILEKTSKETRRRYISRFLNDIGVYYNANIDYGEKKGREHYHGCVVLKDNIKPHDAIETYHKIAKGSMLDIKPIWQKNSNAKLSAYITKLTNHAFKETTKREHIIYSKNKIVSE